MQKNRKTLLIIGGTGIVSVMLYFVSEFIFFLLNCLPGDPWMTKARHWLIGIGVPTSFVCKYIAFALLHLPMWLLLFATMFCLGSSRHVWAKLAAIALALWVPIINVVGSIMYYASRSLPPELREGQSQVLFGVHTRIVPTLCGILVCFAGFSLGRRIRTFSKRTVTT